MSAINRLNERKIRVQRRVVVEGLISDEERKVDIGLARALYGTDGLSRLASYPVQIKGDLWSMHHEPPVIQQRDPTPTFARRRGPSWDACGLLSPTGRCLEVASRHRRNLDQLEARPLRHQSTLCIGLINAQKGSSVSCASGDEAEGVALFGLKLPSCQLTG